jgi:hypothetical protein
MGVLYFFLFKYVRGIWYERLVFLVWPSYKIIEAIQLLYLKFIISRIKQPWYRHIDQQTKGQITNSGIGLIFSFLDAFHFFYHRNLNYLYKQIIIFLVVTCGGLLVPCVYIFFIKLKRKIHGKNMQSIPFLVYYVMYLRQFTASIS